MTAGVQLRRADGLVRGLIHARAGRRPYVRLPTVAEAKLLMMLTAGAARIGFVLLSMEGDDGTELLVATRGAETIRFENRQQVGAWLNHLHACGTVGLGEVRAHGGG
jgi:hypothetical protein